MRKDELVKAIMSEVRKGNRKKPTAKPSRTTTSKRNGKSTETSARRAKSAVPKPAKATSKAIAAKKNAKSTSSRSAASASHRSNGHSSLSRNGSAKRTSTTTASRSTTANRRSNAKSNAKATSPKPSAKRVEKNKPSTNPRVLKRIQNAEANRERLRDLTTAARDGTKVPTKDRIVLIVRDAYWLQAHWELTRATVERAQVALAEQWHTARPVLRLVEIEDVSTTNTSERVVRDIDVHGEVADWYIDVPTPSTAYRVMIGYKTANDKFHVLARSNKVVTPEPGSSDCIDENWTDIAENCEKIFAMSGGYDADNSDGELRELFEERLRRPMGSPVVTKFGVGADGILNRKRDFQFEVDAEMIIYGSTHPSAYVTLSGEPVRLRPDGTFTVRLSMPDRRQVLPVVASSSDGVEQHTTVLAVERNTKVMEPFIKESSD